MPVLERRAIRGEVPKTVVGFAYSALGDRDKAVQWLDRGLNAREANFRDGIRTPVVRKLRGDPRYAALLARLERGFDD